jgi:hypothetical protein
VPAFCGRAHDDVFDVVLVDDRVRVDGEPGRREKVDQVSAAHPAAVDEIVALTVTLDAALDRDLVVVDRKPALGVVEDQGHLGERGARAALTAGVDDLLHFLSAEVAGLPGAQDPFDGVEDVGFPGAVGPHDRRHAAFEQDLGRPGKRLEAEEVQRAEKQVRFRVAEGADIGAVRGIDTTCETLLDRIFELTAGGVAAGFDPARVAAARRFRWPQPTFGCCGSAARPLAVLNLLAGN